MTALLSFFLLASLALAAAVPFSPERARARLKALLVVANGGAWIALGAAVAQVVGRTASTLFAPAAARRPEMMEPAARQALLVLASLGGPVLLASALAILAVRSSRPKPKADRPERTP